MLLSSTLMLVIRLKEVNFRPNTRLFQNLHLKGHNNPLLGPSVSGHWIFKKCLCFKFRPVFSTNKLSDHVALLKSRGFKLNTVNC